jgi:hypothetical protein
MPLRGSSQKGTDDLIPDTPSSSSGAAAKYQGNTNTVFNGSTGTFFEKEAGIKFAKSDEGFHGTVSHILTFESGKVRPVLGIFLVPDLTVFYSPTQWIHHFIAIGYAVFLMIFLGETSFPDGAKGSPACSEDDAGHNGNMCQLNDVLSEAADNFQWLIGFVLAGYVATSVATWATRRRNYAALCGTARNLNILVASFIPLDPGDSELMQVRQTLGRWIMLAMELSVLKARASMDSDGGREHLVRLSLIEPGEWEAMVDGDRHSTVFWWIQMELVCCTHVYSHVLITA